MPEDTTDEGQNQQQNQSSDQSQQQAGSQQSAQTTEDTTDWKAEARKWEQRSKENGQKYAEAEKQRRSSMNEQERALADAEERGRTAVRTEYGTRLVRTEFDAAAARRNPDFDTAPALKRLDLTKLLDEHGEPDPKEIKAAVDDLIPASGGASFDGGARRSTAKTGDMNALIRRQAGRG